MKNDKKRRSILYNMAIEALLESDNDLTVGSADNLAKHIVACWIDSLNITFYSPQNGSNVRNKQLNKLNNIDNVLVIYEKSAGYVRKKGEPKAPTRNKRLDSK